MEIWSWVLVSGFLLAAALGLMVSHVRMWRIVQARKEELDPREWQYRRGQYRRRMQTSAMLGILAVALFVGRWVNCPPLSPTWFAVYWAVVLLLVLWLLLLAAADILSTKHHFSRMRDRYAVEEAKLRAELRRIQNVRGNGKAENGPKS